MLPTFENTLITGRIYDDPFFSYCRRECCLGNFVFAKLPVCCEPRNLSMATFLDRRKPANNHLGIALHVKATDSQLLQPIKDFVHAQSIAAPAREQPRIANQGPARRGTAHLDWR